MKKYLIILLVIIATIICTVLIKDYIFEKNSYSPTIYQISKSYENVPNDTSVEVNNLKITLKDFSLSEINKEKLLNLGLDEDSVQKIENFSNNEKCNGLIEFSSLDNTDISEIDFDYLIYDNSNNILASTITYNKSLPKTNLFLKYFIKNEYNSNDVHELDNHLLYSGVSKNIISDSMNSILTLFVSNNVDETKVDSSKIHILLVNPKYKNSTGETIELNDTIIEFILEN